jgi:hypothetical protein
MSYLAPERESIDRSVIVALGGLRPSFVTDTMRTNQRRVKHVNVAEQSTVAELALLFALVVCPALLIPFAENPFEPHKAAFLWTAVFTSAAALIVSGVGDIKALIAERPAFRWIVTASLCSVAAMIVSVSISESPALAWWGSGLRRYGGLTEVVLAGAMVVAATVAIDRDRFDRCLTAIMLGSIGPTLYALFQWAGADPLGPGTAAWQRPGSTFGNPLFLSGYLVTVLPITIAYAARSTLPLPTTGAWGLVVLQIVALVAARSVGPALALGAATVIVGTAILASLGRRRAAAAIGIILAGSTTLVVIVAPQWLRVRASAINAAPYTLTGNQGTVLVRAILWQAAGAGIQHELRALAFGSGPESTKEALTKYSGAALQALEGAHVAADRAHNETLETLKTFGALGIALRLVVLYAALGAAFAALGLPSSASNTGAPRFAVLALFISGALAATTLWRDGVWALAMSVPAAMAVAAALWVAWSSRFTATPDRDLMMPVAAATTAWLAHYFEIQVGIPSVGSGIVGSVAVALTVAGVRGAAESHHASRATSPPTGGSDDSLSVLAGLATAVMLVSLTGAAALTTAAWTVATLTWGVANLILGVQRRSLIISAVAAACVALGWLAVPTTATSPIAQAAAFATRVVALYVISATLLVVAAWYLSRRFAAAAAGGHHMRERARDLRGVQRQPDRRTAMIAVNVLPIAIVSLIVARAAVAVSTADVRLGVARSCEQQRDLSCAASLYMTGRDDRSDTRPPTRLADLLIGEADSAGVERRDQLFRQAAAQLAFAWSVDPFDYDQARNRGALERQWALRLPPGDRAAHLEEADRWYAAAAGLAPAASRLWEEWANLALERRRPDEALPRLERALSLGAKRNDARTLGDAWLRASGIAADEPGGFARAVEEFRKRGYPELAGLYATRAATSTGVR